MSCYKRSYTDSEMCSSDSDEVDFEERIETYFESECGHFPFERVYTFADRWHYQIKDESGYLFLDVPQYLLKSLHMHDCPFANVTAGIINLYVAGLAPVGRRYLKEVKVRDFIVTLKKPLVNVCDGINYRYFNYDIYRAILHRDLTFFKVLVRYGVLRPVVSENDEDFDECLDMLSMYIESIAVPISPPYGLPEGVQDNMDTIFSRLTLLYEKMQSNPGLRSKLLRKQTIIKVLLILSCRESSSSEFAADCLRLYFDATPENFVTVREIQELIDISQQSLEMFDEEVIDLNYTCLRSVFPDSDILQPRTLKHLSRCAVRAHLTERGVLPEVVAKLRIPDIIKDYILISKTGS